LTRGRRARRWASALLLVALAMTALGLAPGRPAGAAPARVYQALVIGDSVMAGISLYPSGVPALQAKHTTVLDLKVCRRLVAASCPYQGVAPPNAITTLKSAAGTFTRALVVGVGYNDTTANVAAGVDQIMAEAQRQGIPTVIWFTYQQRGKNAGLYAAHNATLFAKQQQYGTRLRVADWNAYSASHNEWFSSTDPTGVHLTPAGAAALTAYLSFALDLFAGADRCASANWAGAPVPGTAAPSVGGGQLHMLASPARLVDTRSLAGRVGAGRVLKVQVGGTNGVPSGAVAAVVTVTAVRPCANAFASVGPCANTITGTSLMNPPTSSVVANSATVALAQGALCVYVSQPTDVVVDLLGWYGPAGAGSRVVAPLRLVDTRPGMAQTLPVPQQRVAARGVLALAVGGVAPGAAALTVNITAAFPAAAGFVTAFPGPCPATLATAPATSSVNFARGATTAGSVVVGVASNQVCVYASVATDLIVDLQGVHDGAGHDVLPVPTTRVIDTRTLAPGAPVAAGATLTADLDGLLPVPAGADAAIVNLTSLSSAASGWITAYPCGQPVPGASNLNPVRGAIVANMALVPLTADHRICLYSRSSTHLLVDVEGWIL
jgi:hypothetical protein